MLLIQCRLTLNWLWGVWPAVSSFTVQSLHLCLAHKCLEISLGFVIKFKSKLQNPHISFKTESKWCWKFISNIRGINMKICDPTCLSLFYSRFSCLFLYRTVWYFFLSHHTSTLLHEKSSRKCVLILLQ